MADEWYKMMCQESVFKTINGCNSTSWWETMISCIMINAPFILCTCTHRHTRTQQGVFTRTSLSVAAIMTGQWEIQPFHITAWIYMINNPGLVVISTVFGIPMDLSHIFCQTSVNIYCGGSVLLSAVIVNLPSLCLLTDESDPWPGGARGRGGRRYLYVMCVVCVLVSSGPRISFKSHEASYIPHSVIMPGSVLSYLFAPSTNKKTSTPPSPPPPPHTNTHN